MRKVWTLLGFLFLALNAGAAIAEPLRLTVFGDSLVQGYGLPQGQGLVPQLSRWLADQGAEAELANAGVSGDTTAGGAARIGCTLADKPDGIIVLLGGNDLLRGLHPEEAEANLRSILQQSHAAGVEVLLVGMRAPGNFGPQYKQVFDNIYPQIAPEFDALLHPDAFAGIRAKVGEDPAAARDYMQGDNIHPNAAGVALNVAALGPKVLELIRRIQG